MMTYSRRLYAATTSIRVSVTDLGQLANVLMSTIMVISALACRDRKRSGTTSLSVGSIDGPEELIEIFVGHALTTASSSSRRRLLEIQ
jgi:hypothetical protein